MLKSITSKVSEVLERSGKSKASSLFAALAVIIAAACGYIGSSYSSDSVACDIRIQQADSKGAPYFRYGQSSVGNNFYAELLMDIASKSENLDVKRQNAYLAIHEVNTGIGENWPDPETNPVLLKFPSDSDLRNGKYYKDIVAKFNQITDEQLENSVKNVDQEFLGEVFDKQSCLQRKNTADNLNILALIFTVLSVFLIGLREYNGNV
jgi:hypothetical protein